MVRILEVLGEVVHVEVFKAKTNGKLYTKLFVPVGFDVIAVIANGDQSSLRGQNVIFRLGVKDGQLKLFYKEEV